VSITTNPSASAQAHRLLGELTSEPLVQVALNIAFGLALLLLGMRIGRWLTNFEHRVLLRAHVDAILADFLRNVTYAIFLVLLLVSALDISGFPTATLLTVVGAAGIAIGLALKDSLAHIAAGVILIVLRPFRAGDSVKIAGQEGVVEGVFIFQTRLHSPDNRDIVLMNGAVLGAPIINYSQRATRRVDVVLHLATTADLGQALALAQQAVAADARVQTDPAPTILITEIAETGVALSIQVWCRSDDLDSVRSDLLRRTHDTLSQHDIAFAQLAQPPRKLQ
jgi:small-conductance mechanosensitive channel